jgi:hypothetical protein
VKAHALDFPAMGALLEKVGIGLRADMRRNKNLQLEPEPVRSAKLWDAAFDSRKDGNRANTGQHAEANGSGESPIAWFQSQILNLAVVKVVVPERKCRDGIGAALPSRCFDGLIRGSLWIMR